MNSFERWERIKDIFEAALSRTGGERRAYLEGACGDDPEMLKEVESLLSSFDAEYLEGAAIDEVADVFVSRSASRLKPGAVVGQYEIVAELGKGGQGSVYKAVDTNLNRTVAIKALPSELLIDETARKRFTREAKLASSLDHPNICAVHDLVESAGSHLIVMQYIEGRNVRELVNGKPLEISSALRIGIQVCDALAAAHSKGIIHRDIKAHNVIVTDNGVAKILDFGLAKITLEGDADQTELTALGSPYGTPTYAAPEQSRGEKADHRADIFSTGVLMYELLTGTWAFHGKTAIDVRHAVLHDKPKPISERRGEEIPASLNSIVERALEKEPERRFQSVREMRDAMIEVLRSLSHGEDSTRDDFLSRYDDGRPKYFVSRAARVKRYAIGGTAILLILLGFGGYFYRASRNSAWASEQYSKVNQLAKERRFFEAYDIAQEVMPNLPEGVMDSVLPIFADELSVTSNESGASVFLTRYTRDGTAKREFIGLVPISKKRIARGEYILEVEKEGFGPFRRTISGNPEVYWDLTFNPPPTSVDARLFPSDEIPQNMVFVPGGDYRLTSWRKPTNSPARLGDYFIDRYEVSNREYKEFVAAGGYVRREFWKQPFIRDGKTIEWESAIVELRDKTGMPGPRSWIGQSFPEGRGDHPVTDITWHEAAAYAEFRGKSLPSIFQWEKAARNGALTQSADEIMPWGYFDPAGGTEGRANIASRDSVPVTANEFGMSPFGCYNMAGNVAEWCFNETDEGYATAGGSWGDPSYTFGSIASFPGTYTSNKLGFRCVKNLVPDGPHRSRFEEQKAVPVYTPVGLAEFSSFRRLYRYDKSLSTGRVIETVDAPEWRREKLEFSGANDSLAIGYLYLPKNAKAPYQVIAYLPAGDVYGGFSTLPTHVETFASSQIKAGRAVFAVVLRGFIGREHPPGHKPPAIDSIRYRDEAVTDVRDIQRGLDYLETRPDMDMSKLSFWGYSAGAEFGVIVAALDPRFRSAVFMADGLSLLNQKKAPEVNIANFAPYIRIPKLLINGRYDEQYSWRLETEPLIRLLREPKQLVQYDGGHTPPQEIAIPAISRFLDEHLGPVAH